MSFRCSKCGSSNYIIEKHGYNTNAGLYCADCRKWHKWLSDDEVRAYSHEYKKEKYVSRPNLKRYNHFFTILIESMIEKNDENENILVKYTKNDYIDAPTGSNVTLIARLYDYDKEIFIDDSGCCEFGKIVWEKQCSDGSMKDVHTGKTFTFISQNDQYYTATLMADPDLIEKIEDCRQSYDVLINQLKDFTDYLDKVIDRELMKEPLSEGDGIRKCAYCTALERDKNALLNIIDGKDWRSRE